MEPVLGMLGVAVEPEPRPVHRAPRDRLLHKGTRHQRDLVKKHARQRHALNQRRRRLVLTAEKVETLLPSAIAHQQQVLRQLLLAGKAERLQERQNRSHHIAPQRTNGLAAEGKIRAAAKIEAPDNEGQRHTEGLAAPHRSVADDRVPAAVGGLLMPPAQHTQLLRRKALNHRHHFRRRSCRSRRTGCPRYGSPHSWSRASPTP